MEAQENRHANHKEKCVSSVNRENIFPHLCQLGNFESSKGEIHTIMERYESETDTEQDTKLFLASLQSAVTDMDEAIITLLTGKAKNTHKIQS